MELESDCYPSPPGPYHNWDLHTKWLTALHYLTSHNVPVQVRLGTTLPFENPVRCITKERTLEPRLWLRNGALS